MPLVNNLDITGKLTNSELVDSGNLNVKGTISGSSHLQVTGGNITSSGGLGVSGQLADSNIIDSGALNIAKNVSGRTRLPDILDSTAIHYDTTESWNSKPLLIGERSHIYIYSDYGTTEIGGETVMVPAMKVGDGTSYLIDMPFITAGSSGNVIVKSTSEWASTPDLVSTKGFIYVYMDKDGEGNITEVKFKIGDGTAYVIDMPFASPSQNDFDAHINNQDIHVTLAEKDYWNNKWRGYLLGSTEGENLVFTTH